MSSADSYPEGYVIPLYVVLTQPRLIGGVPRELAICNLTLTMMVALSLRLWWIGIPLGVAVHTIAAILTRFDPDWWPIARRHLRQPNYLSPM